MTDRTVETREKLLIVDDDPGIVRGLRWSLSDYDLIGAGDRVAAVAAARRHQPKVVTIDLGLPPRPDEAEEGLATLDELRTALPHAKLIVVSGNEELRHAAGAIGRGAWDFYAKPIVPVTLGMIVARAFHVHALEDENRRLRNAEAAAATDLIAADRVMLDVCRTIERVAPTEISVLLLGESGTGKEVLARMLHDRGDRRQGPFVPINCAAIPETLLESELFGHEKGAFTGASRQVKGKVELASGGTLFLDEIGDMPVALQAKLLRFLQERRIERIGGRELLEIDARIVCATHQDLRRRIEQGLFREDLFYRISELVIRIPALRERGDDVIVLAQHFATRFAQRQGLRAPRLGADALQAIRSYPWPGNVRELENRLRRGVILGNGDRLTAADLDLETVMPDGRSEAVTTLRDARARAERKVILATMAYTQGNMSAAAKTLEISRPTLYNLMREHGLTSASAAVLEPAPEAYGMASLEATAPPLAGGEALQATALPGLDETR